MIYNFWDKHTIILDWMVMTSLFVMFESRTRSFNTALPVVIHEVCQPTGQGGGGGGGGGELAEQWRAERFHVILPSSWRTQEQIGKMSHTGQLRGTSQKLMSV